MKNDTHEKIMRDKETPPKKKKQQQQQQQQQQHNNNTKQTEKLVKSFILIKLKHKFTEYN